MKVRSLSTSFTLLSLAISTQLYAQTVETAPSTQAVVVESQKTAQLAPIVVTATRSAQSIAEIAGTVQSIEQKQIEQQAAAGRKRALHAIHHTRRAGCAGRILLLPCGQQRAWSGLEHGWRLDCPISALSDLGP